MAIFCLFNGVCTTHPLIYDYNLLGSICDQEFTRGIFERLAILPFQDNEKCSNVLAQSCLESLITWN